MKTTQQRNRLGRAFVPEGVSWVGQGGKNLHARLCKGAACVVVACANSADEDGYGQIVELANAGQVLDADGWLRLAPYGDHLHRRAGVVQRLDKEAAEAMASHFRGLANQVGRWLAGGPPVFVGHPDAAGYAGTAGNEDDTVRGRITALEAREDGLYGKIRWENDGRRLVTEGKFKAFSPFWNLAPVAGTNGVWRPTALRSVSLTNTPMIREAAIANGFAGTEAEKPVLVELLSQLGFGSAEIELLRSSWQSLPTIESVAAKVRALSAQARAAEAAVTTAQTAANATRELLAEVATQAALREGRLTGSEVAAEKTALANAADLGAAVAALATRPVALPVAANAVLPRTGPRSWAAFHAAVAARVERGESYDAAWLAEEKQMNA